MANYKPNSNAEERRVRVFTCPHCNDQSLMDRRPKQPKKDSDDVIPYIVMCHECALVINGDEVQSKLMHYTDFIDGVK